MRIRAGLSMLLDAGDAVREAAAALTGPIDLAFLFLSPAHAEAVGEAVDTARRVLRPRHLVGCVAEGVVGGGRELEEGPALAVWAADLPGAAVEAFHLAAVDTGGGTVVSGVPPLDGASLLALIADPFTFPTAPFLAGLNEQCPGLPVVGGLAVGGPEAGRGVLVLDEDVHREGAIGVRLGGVPVVTVVSQGCAPIGREAVVTSADGNVVFELAGEPALKRLREDLARLSAEEQALAAQGILAGLVVDENREDYGAGDYLMRAVVGADDDSGAIAVGERVRVGQTLRFHVRDARSADEDLRRSLARSLPGAQPAGALLFTCNGRGTNMFEEPDHDIGVLGASVDPERVAGFFCGGEIGPVGARSFLHGFTATMAVFLQPEGDPAAPDV